MHPGDMTTRSGVGWVEAEALVGSGPRSAAPGAGTTGGDARRKENDVGKSDHSKIFNVFACGTIAFCCNN